jgi:hypothetical protein
MEEDLIISNQTNIEMDYKELKEDLNNWSNILLGDQYLKLYFSRLGISNSLVVNRIVKMEDFISDSNYERILFVIVRSKLNEENIDKRNKGETIYNYSRDDFSCYKKTFFENNFLFFVRFF